jgi:hypothetical protein
MAQLEVGAQHTIDLAHGASLLISYEESLSFHWIVMEQF